MSHDELITKAREQMTPIKRTESCTVRVEDFPEVRVRETVVVYFSRHDRDDHMEVCLDRDTGEIVGALYIPPKSEQRHSEKNIAKCD